MWLKEHWDFTFGTARRSWYRVTAGDLRFHERYGGEAMNVLITGSNGLIGSALMPFLGGGGHQVRRLLRTESHESDTTS